MSGKYWWLFTTLDFKKGNYSKMGEDLPLLSDITKLIC
jgi:hypothetical protein